MAWSGNIHGLSMSRSQLIRHASGPMDKESPHHFTHHMFIPIPPACFCLAGPTYDEKRNTKDWGLQDNTEGKGTCHQGLSSIPEFTWEEERSDPAPVSWPLTSTYEQWFPHKHTCTHIQINKQVYKTVMNATDLKFNFVFFL